MATTEKYLEIVLIVKKKKPFISTELPDDDDILTGVKEIEQTIKNYCRIPKVPDALDYVWANMVIDLLLYDIESSTKPEDVLDAFDPSDVSTIKVGDTTIVLGDKYRSNQRSRTLQSHQANLDNLIMNYREQLNQFRRIW